MTTGGPAKHGNSAAPGPASMGIPRGIMLASRLLTLSSASAGVAFVLDWRACSMSRPICSNMIPPAILNAGNVMPNILKIKLPATANVERTIAQVHAERRAIQRRSCGGESEVTARKSGITVKGSTRKKIEVAASNANSRTWVTDAGMCGISTQS